MFNWLYDQETILYMHKIKIQANAQRKEFIRKKNIRKGYVSKKHNLVR